MLDDQLKKFTIDLSQKLCVLIKGKSYLIRTPIPYWRDTQSKDDSGPWKIWLARPWITKQMHKIIWDVSTKLWFLVVSWHDQRPVLCNSHAVTVKKLRVPTNVNECWNSKAFNPRKNSKTYEKTPEKQTVTAPAIIRNVWNMSVQITAESPPKMVNIPQIASSKSMEM